MLPHYSVPCETLMSDKQAINDKLQGSVATYLRCGGVVNYRIKTGLLLSLSVKKIKLMNIWRSYKQECGCLVHFLRLLAVWWPGAQSALDNYLLACNFAKYLPNLKQITYRLKNKHFLLWLLTTQRHLKYAATQPCNSLIACFRTLMFHKIHCSMAHRPGVAGVLIKTLLQICQRIFHWKKFVNR